LGLFNFNQQPSNLFHAALESFHCPLWGVSKQTVGATLVTGHTAIDTKPY